MSTPINTVAGYCSVYHAATTVSGERLIGLQADGDTPGKGAHLTPSQARTLAIELIARSADEPVAALCRKMIRSAGYFVDGPEGNHL